MRTGIRHVVLPTAPTDFVNGLLRPIRDVSAYASLQEKSPMPSNKAPQTIAVSNGIGEDSAFGAVTPPLYLSTNFTFEGFERARQYDYTRSGNPTRDLLANTIAQLEGGAGAIVVSTGMAAVDLSLASLEPGDLIIAPHDCYAGTWRLLNARQAKRQFEVAFIDQSDQAMFEMALARCPKLVLIETPSNPLMRVVDIRSIAVQAKGVGAKVVVDKTFLSPALQQPIQLGADLIVHSTTKFLNGHSDVVGGVVIAADQADLDALQHWANVTGITGSPFDAFLTLRGIRTLFTRVESQQRTTAAVVALLTGHSAVRVVHYPGLPSHPGHAIARVQQRGFGSMLSFEIEGGVSSIRRFIGAVKIFSLAESLSS